MAHQHAQIRGRSPPERSTSGHQFTNDEQPANCRVARPKDCGSLRIASAEYGVLEHVRAGPGRQIGHEIATHDLGAISDAGCLKRWPGDECPVPATDVDDRVESCKIVGGEVCRATPEP
jgi:hypothetical protein